MRAYWTRLGWRGRATWLAHLYKACLQQHHREMVPLLRALLPPDGVVHVLAYGLSDAHAELLLKTPIKRSGSAGFGIASLGDPGGNATHITEPVQLRRLDDVVDDLRIDRLDLLKADIEGWELRMLTGARATLARFRPALLVELSPAALARAGDDLDGVRRLLEPLGYRPHLKSADADTWHPAWPTGAADVLWLTQRHAAGLDGARSVIRPQ